MRRRPILTFVLIAASAPPAARAAPADFRTAVRALKDAALDAGPCGLDVATGSLKRGVGVAPGVVPCIGRVSLSIFGSDESSGGINAAPSGDGRFVAFRSSAPELQRRAPRSSDA